MATKKITTHIRLDPDLHEAVVGIAAEKGRSVANLLGRWAEKEVEQLYPGWRKAAEGAERE